MSNKDYPAIAAAIGMAFFFGFSFIFTRSALEYIEPIHFLGFRFFLAALIVNILRWVGVIKINIPLRRWREIMLLAFFQPVLYFVCETIGIQMTSASEGGMMVALIPIFTVSMAAIFLKERPAIPQVISIILSVSGVLLIGYMQATQEIGRNFIGLLILLGAPLSGGAFSNLSRYFSRNFKPIELTYIMMNVGAGFFLGLSLIMHSFRGRLDQFLLPLGEPIVISAIFYLAIFSSVVAFFLINFTLSRLPASQVSAFPSLTTLIAVTSGVVILGESLYWFHFLGAILIIIGVWGTNYFTPRDITPPTRS